MSFVRIRKTTSGTGLPRKRRIPKKKPAWDDTQQDLTRMRATPEEIEQRKLAHKSKFALASRLEKQHRMKGGSNMSISNAEAHQLAIMKEVLYDQQQFHEVISKSDKMMAVVKDLFGDDPKRFTGFPNVTAAPNTEDGDRSDTLVAPLPDFQTRMEAISDSVMDQSALNDLLNSDSEDGDEPEPITYQPKMNMQRFQQFLAAEEKNNTLSTISGQAHLSHLDHGPGQSTRIQDTQSLQTTQENEFTTPPRKEHNESVEILQTPKSAMNDTKKIKKTKKRTAQENGNTTSHNTSAMPLTDLRKVLEGLENEIAEYERQTGRRPIAEQPRQETFSGYTLSLVDSVTKLTRYLKENEIRLKAETTVREALTQDVSQLTNLIDALTSDIIHTQEEYGKLQSQFIKYRQDTQREINMLKEVLLHAGILTTSETVHVEEKSQPIEAPEMVKPQFYEDDKEDVDRHVPDYLQNVPSAVLLTPPVRKTRIQEQQQEKHRDSQTSEAGISSVSDASDQQPQPQPSYPQAFESVGYHPTHSQPIPIPHQHSMNPKAVYSHGQRPMQMSHIVPEPNPQLPGQIINQHNGVSRPFSNGYVPQDNESTTSQAPSSSTNQSSVSMGANRVSVPRPIPLVQSNVGIPIHPRPEQPQGRPPSGRTTEDKDFLASQIAELNKQHEEAQRRLHTLMQQQHEGVHLPQGQNVQHTIQITKPENSVSPPISPISQRSDFISIQGMTNQDSTG